MLGVVSFLCFGVVICFLLYIDAVKRSKKHSNCQRKMFVFQLLNEITRIIEAS